MPKRKFELEYDSKPILMSPSWKESHEYVLSFMVGDTLRPCTLSLCDQKIWLMPDQCRGFSWTLKKLHTSAYPYIKEFVDHEIATLADFDNLDETVATKIFDAILQRAKEMCVEYTPCDVCDQLFYP